jgi:hypothetical protein
MTTYAWMALAVAALMLGAAIGAYVTFRLSRVRLSKRVRRVTEDLQHRHATTLDQLRAAQVRTQTELEQARNTFKRQLAVASEEPRAAASRAEDRLKAAYAELDRLRSAARTGTETGTAELSDGFAATRPMRESM